MDVVAHGEEAYVSGEGAILVTPEAGLEEEVPVRPGRLDRGATGRLVMGSRPTQSRRPRGTGQWRSARTSRSSSSRQGLPSLAGLRAYAATASRLGYRWLTANDHLVFRRPWLDGLTALAAVLDASGDLGLATTVCLPAVRGPAQAAKAFAALDLLSDGRFVAGLGPGSSERDYVVGGVPAEDRFARFEEAVGRPGRCSAGTREPFAGRFYSRVGVTLEPPPRASRTAAHLAGRLGRLARTAARGGARRRLARLRLQHHAGALRRLVGARSPARGRPRRRPRPLRQRGRHPLGLCDRGPRRCRAILADVLAPLLGRPVDWLREPLLPIGPAEVCAQRLSAFAEAGAQRVFFWQLGDDVRQLELLAERVVPLVETVRRP